MAARPGVITTSYRSGRRLLDTRVRRLWAVAGALAMLAVPSAVSGATVNQVNYIMMAVIGATALNVLMGVGGQVSIGNAALLCVGGFTAGLVTYQTSRPFLLVVLCAGVAAAVVGAIVGFAAVKLRGLYAVIATLALQFIVAYIALRIQREVTGDAGFIMDKPSIGPWHIESEVDWYFLLLVVVGGVLLLARNLLKGRFGRAWRMMAQHDIAAEMVGIDVRRQKVVAFAVTSFAIGVQGALAGYYLRVVNQSSYGFEVAIQYVAMVVIGGLGSLLGSVLGAIFVVGTPFLILNLSPRGQGYFVDRLASIQAAIYGLAIIGFVLFEPHGLARIVKRIRTSFVLWPFAKERIQ